MFAKSKPTPESASPPSSGASKMASTATGGRHTTFSILGADVIVTGNIAASVDLHIDGKVQGDLKCANLVQGESSEIKGSVFAETAKLAGMIDGSIEAKTLVIHASARITGDVTYESVTIEQGAHVDGKLTHRRAGVAKPALGVVGGTAGEAGQLAG